MVISSEAGGGHQYALGSVSKVTPLRVYDLPSESITGGAPMPQPPRGSSKTTYKKSERLIALNHVYREMKVFKADFSDKSSSRHNQIGRKYSQKFSGLKWSSRMSNGPMKEGSL